MPTISMNQGFWLFQHKCLTQCFSRFSHMALIHICCISSVRLELFYFFPSQRTSFGQVRTQQSSKQFCELSEWAGLSLGPIQHYCGLITVRKWFNPVTTQLQEANPICLAFCVVSSIFFLKWVAKLSHEAQNRAKLHVLKILDWWRNRENIHWI